MLSSRGKLLLKNIELKIRLTELRYEAGSIVRLTTFSKS